MMLETASIEQALVERGVNGNVAAWVSVWMEPGTVERTIKWFDAQGGRVNAGVLVEELRRGGHPGPQRSSIDEQAAYGREIVAWLREHFPALNSGEASHPAAIAAVIRLDHRHQRRRSARDWGPEIRAAVSRFNRELLED